MGEAALVQARIEAEIKEKAKAVFERMGLTLSDVVRIVLTRVAKEGAVPPGLLIDEAAYDAWFRERVKQAMDDPSPRIPNERVEAEFAARRLTERSGNA